MRFIRMGNGRGGVKVANLGSLQSKPSKKQLKVSKPCLSYQQKADRDRITKGVKYVKNLLIKGNLSVAEELTLVAGDERLAQAIKRHCGFDYTAKESPGRSAESIGLSKEEFIELERNILYKVYEVVRFQDPIRVKKANVEKYPQVPLEDPYKLRPARSARSARSPYSQKTDPKS